jgi:hypothetical protein
MTATTGQGFLPLARNPQTSSSSYDTTSTSSLARKTVAKRHSDATPTQQRDSMRWCAGRSWPSRRAGTNSSRALFCAYGFERKKPALDRRRYRTASPAYSAGRFGRARGHHVQANRTSCSIICGNRWPEISDDPAIEEKSLGFINLHIGVEPDPPASEYVCEGGSIVQNPNACAPSPRRPVAKNAKAKAKS